MIAFPDNAKIRPEPRYPHRPHFIVREVDFLAAVELHGLTINGWGVFYELPSPYPQPWRYAMTYERLENGTVFVSIDPSDSSWNDQGQMETARNIWADIALPEKRFIGTSFEAGVEVVRAINDWAQVRAYFFHEKNTGPRVLKSIKHLGPDMQLNFYDGWMRLPGYLLTANNPFAATMDYLSED